uniref:Helicase ATP-binding domain-containing protein n=1 Tax=Timspurckia oligopyrenoides TaxID=708627 RepID=A0A7S0ZIM9_9RHOD|mmetsp:Transcript_6813/g.12188  ORF Transcript_6813/g.12188 Transcript_6813/m.12188 type:complete len:827 (+) Transcript_6813:23-2503(+)
MNERIGDVGSKSDGDGDFRFPFIPYESQILFMKSLYKLMNEGGVGFFESPTGTGKSLSVICCALKYLRDARSDSNRQDLEKNKNTEEEPDWITNFASNKLAENLQDERMRLKQKIQAKQRSKSQSGQKYTRIGEDDLVIVSSSDSESDSEDSFNIGRRTVRWKKQKSESDVLDRPTVIYCSRTHSQIVQFIHEMIRVEDSKNYSVVSVGGRRQMCVNEKVSALRSAAAVNERCSELLESQRSHIKSEDQKVNLHPDVPASKRRKKAPKSSQKGCPYYSKKRITVLSDTIRSEVHDIEELVSIGKKTKACPYFASRKAMESGYDFIVAPYAAVLHAPTRDSIGLVLNSKSVLVFDEAHNVVDAVNDAYSAELRSIDLNYAIKAATLYLERYEMRLSAQNLFLVRQFLDVLAKISKYIGSMSLFPDSKQVLKVSELIFDCQLENYNLFELIRFIHESNICRKLLGFLDVYTDNCTEVVDASQEQPSRGCFHACEGFIQSLTAPVEDGRVVVTHESIKFLMLNPAAHFKSILDSVRAVVFVGGTLSPKQYIAERLIRDHSSECKEQKSRDSIVEFACGHIIPKSNLLTLVLSKGPTGKRLDLSFSQRQDPELIDEIGRCILNVCRVSPAGVVVFFPSYTFEETVHKQWESSRILASLANVKRIFREKRGASSDEMLKEYKNSIFSSDATTQKQHGAVLFAVIGGKLSEGINFSDDLGRCVMVVGMPFPNPRDPELIQVIDHIKTTIGSGYSAQYMEDLCMKAVNQTIGRAIRHAKDYASIILLDHRYERASIQNKLPSWIRDDLISTHQFGQCIRNLSTFFKSHTQSKL